MTFNDLATDAYIKNGVLAPGETLDSNLSAYAMREANRMLDQWNIQPLYIYTETIYTFNLTARPITNSNFNPAVTQYWYTIGPGPQAGNPPQPDFVAVRPNDIIRANLLLSTTSPAARVPLSIWDHKQWAAETVPFLGTAPIPIGIYCDFGFENSAQLQPPTAPQGNARLYVWPYPNASGNQLELFIPVQNSRFATINDIFALPMGWEDAFLLTLSERTCEGIRDVPPTLATAAARARAAIRAMNSKSPKISTVDSGMPGGQTRSGQGNFYDGWIRNR